MKINLIKMSFVFAAVLAGAGISSAAEDKPAKAPETKAAAPAATKAAPAKNMEALMNPAKANETAPKTFKVRFTTTKGDIVLEAHRDWSPNGADRFYNLVKIGFFDDIAFFRAVDGFMVQFGIHGLPEISAKWREANIKDDPPAGQSNKPGTLSFATAGPNTRTTQFFINYGNNAQLDSSKLGEGFTPFAVVIQGMDVVNSLYKGYGEGAPRGMGPDQGRIQMEGNAYLKREFPKLDSIKSAQILTAPAATTAKVPAAKPK